MQSQSYGRVKIEIACKAYEVDLISGYKVHRFSFCYYCGSLPEQKAAELTVFYNLDKFNFLRPAKVRIPK